jgi:hypothetical protein
MVMVELSTGAMRSGTSVAWAGIEPTGLSRIELNNNRVPKNLSP